MTHEQLKRELFYQMTMRYVEKMRSSAIITESEYRKCQEMMLEKYHPPIGRIVSN